MSTDTADRLRDGYQKWYDVNENEWTPFVPRLAAATITRLDAATELLSEERGGALLDVGCGAGQFPISMAARFARIVGIDYTPSRIELARRVIAARYPELAGRAEFRVSSADEPLPFADRSFDAVTVISVFEHVRDVFTTMEEFVRVLRPGGVLVITARNACFYRDALDLFRGRLPSTWRAADPHDVARWRELGGWQGGVFHQFNRPSLDRLLRLYGLTPERWRPFGRFARRLSWCTNLCAGIAVRGRLGAAPA